MNMEYFIATNATDKKIIGKAGYPQCKGVPSSMGLTFKWLERPNSMTNLTNAEFPDFEPELIFELEEKAVLTDVVSPCNISAKGFLINSKVKNVFSQFNLMEHRYYPATLIVKGERHEYFWTHFKELEEYYLSKINFSKSAFYIGNLARRKEADLEIASVEDYYRIKNNIGFKTINFERVALQKVNEQLFFINQMHNGFNP
jgi:hypothetical protein